MANATTAAMPRLERRLRAETTGDVMADAFSRGRYATDASIYQMMPLAVVVPRTTADVAATLAIAREEGLAVLPRGGGTSQCGQTVNNAIVIDTTRHLDRILAFDAAAATCAVEPGLVLDQLNRFLKPHGLWFPVDVSTSSRATLGGMAGNNSCGGRSIRYGIMRDNVLSIDALLADGSRARFGQVDGGCDGLPAGLADHLLALGRREADEIAVRFPKVQRRVGGYNIDALVPGVAPPNLAHLLVGSEGTLAVTTVLALKLHPIPRNKVMGIAHFPSFYQAMASTKDIVKLGPTAVELVDRTMLDLAGDIAMFRPVLDAVVRGRPDALLLVEFAEPDQEENLRRLKQLAELVGDLGFGWNEAPSRQGGVVDVIDPALQGQVTEVRKSGLNIMMSMRSEGKPVSFVEDCAVPLEDLADYTAGLTAIFEKHGTRGTWYAHASVGCLHVRPVLNVRLDKDVKAMRAIAEEAFAMVRAYKGSHSGEHGDGIARSEFHAEMFGARMVENFREVKRRFDPESILNPGKIVDPPRMDDRRLFRYGETYRVPEIATALDWSGWSGAGGGFQGAVEMCNNNGACRKLEGGAMCPSFRVTRRERDLTRGRANVLRLAISGQLGADALVSDDMAEALKLCVACKACKRECPTGVDMARMKIEVTAARIARHGLPLRERLIAELPRYAPIAARLAPLLNLRNRWPWLARVMESMSGISARRPLPTWRRRPFDAALRGGGGHHARRSDAPGIGASRGGAGTPRVAVLADTFNRSFEPENIDSAISVLERLGYAVEVIGADERRPICCGRTYLSNGLVDKARDEARRLIASAKPLIDAGVPVIGLEPSCISSLRDEYLAMGLGDDALRLAKLSATLEEFLAAEIAAERLAAPLGRLDAHVHLHTHCHQKALGAAAAVADVLRRIEGLTVNEISSSCCGMAGAFGYGRETYDVSMAMAELSLLPAVRAAASDDIIAADGFSCRHQIADGAGVAPLHVARILDRALSTQPLHGGSCEHV